MTWQPGNCVLSGTMRLALCRKSIAGLLLCCLEGKSYDKAARENGLPEKFAGKPA